MVFTSEQVYFQCCAMRACESQPQPRSTLIAQSTQNLWDEFPDLIFPPGTIMSEGSDLHFYQLMESYLFRELTYDADALMHLKAF
jgi:hypothetical protein